MHLHHNHAGGAVIKEDDKAMCPVMHMPVSKQAAEASGLVRTHKGERYYLCCDACTASFEQNPEQYAHNHQEDAHE